MREPQPTRQVPVRVKLLDDDTFSCSIDKESLGCILFNKVCEHVNILEKDYFGLNYYVNGEKFWLNNDKKIAKQLKDQNWVFNFEVKFYPPDQAHLAEDITRYQLCLQIRRDIVNERLPCSFLTHKVLGSYTAQSELGDYDTEEIDSGYKYLNDIQFAPHQDKELLISIANLHRHHKGETPEEADVHFLENAKNLAMYGVELHAAKDAEGIDIQLGVCSSGLVVYKDKQQINKFTWPKVLKISYRRNKYYIEIRPREFEDCSSLIEFKLANAELSERLWKISVEHHSFFRFKTPEHHRNVRFLPRFGSRFRYTGKTQFQTRQIASEENRESPNFDRLHSKRGTFSGRSKHTGNRDEVIDDSSIVDFRRHFDKADGGALEIDSVWRKIRPWGKYQMFQFFLILIDYIPACFAILSAVFTGYIPDYECKVPQNNDNVTSVNDNFTYKASQCNYEVYSHSANTSVFVEKKECNHFTYSNTLTYAYEWDLVCDRANLAALAQSLVLAGQGLGALIMSHIADRFGRKTVHVLSHLGVMISMIFMSFSTNIIMLLTLRLVTGTFQQGIVCTGKILALEMFPREVRSHTEAATFIAWSVGIMVLSLYGYIFRGIDWRYLQVGLAAFSFYALFEWWMMDESVRWLITNGKVDQAKLILKKATRWNKVNYKAVESLPYFAKIELETSKSVDTELDSIDNTDETEIVKTKRNKAVEKYNVLDILKNPKLRLNTIILWYSWIVATGTYYGLTLISTHLAGDRFVNFFLSGVIEIPSLLLEFYLFNKIGRKKTMILWFATAGISLIISTAILTVFKENGTVETISTVFSLIGKSASTGCFSTVFLYTPELYPTNYRNSGLGIASAISRIGGILAPFASNLALIALWIPGAIFGGMCILVAVFALRLPESASHELPTTIAECNKMDKVSVASYNSDEIDGDVASVKTYESEV